MSARPERIPQASVPALVRKFLLLTVNSNEQRLNKSYRRTGTPRVAR